MNTTSKTKLTAVTIGNYSRKIQAFVQCPVDEKGKPHLPMSVYNQLCSKLNADHRGQTITVG